jgi:hypothetical protein
LEEKGNIKAGRASAGFIASLIAGILLLATSLWNYATVTTLGHNLSTRFIDMTLRPQITTYLVLGLILSFAEIAAAIIMYNPGRKWEGSILVLIFSPLSILAAGGFLVGFMIGTVNGVLGIFSLVFGIIGGILGLLEK